MRGEKVQMLKIDPYLSQSASLLAPGQHGETYVGHDGIEGDLDLGNMWRLASIDVSSRNIWTAGKLFAEILEEESNGKYLGSTVQLMPHMTNKIIEKFRSFEQESTVVIIEIGGSVGDLESDLFFSAVCQFKQDLGDKQVMIIHVAPILWVNTVKEFKTKPLQNSVRELRQRGIHPDMLLCRTSVPIDDPSLLDKVARMTGTRREAVFEAPDVSSVYEVPLSFYDRHIDDFIVDRLGLKRVGVKIHAWRNLVDTYIKNDLPTINVGVVGKYVKVTDSYLSLKEAIFHAGVSHKYKANISWIDAEKVEDENLDKLDRLFENLNCVIIPGGFGDRGTLGIQKAITYCRVKKIPLLGICLGLQCAVIEFAKNVCSIYNANSVEFKKEDEKITPVIHWVDGMEHIKKKSGTLRLGAYDCTLTKGSLVNHLYKKKNISEIHRHRYEVNNEYVGVLEHHGLKVSGVHPETNLVEFMELDKAMHPFFILTQAHPEFKSRLDNPHPLFEGLIRAGIDHQELNKIKEKNV
jgi:CTP synthase